MAIEPVTHLEKTIAGTVEPVTHLEQVIAEYGGGGGGGGSVTAADLDDSFKDALLDCFANVAWATENGQQYYDALETALYPPDHITAVYTQSGAVYTTTSLVSLKSDLVVTATYAGGTTATISAEGYTLSGTLEPGTSTITVSYGGKTTTFTVTVSEVIIQTGYTEVGSPTITDNILTVGNQKYVVSNYTLDDTDKPWKVRLKLRKDGRPVQNYTDIVGSVDSSNQSVRGFLLESNSVDLTNIGCYLSSSGESWDIAAAQFAYIDISNWLWLEFEFTGTNYVLRSSSDGETFTAIKTIASSTPITDGFYVGFGLFRSGYFAGEIDLTACKIWSDGNLVWSAV